MYGTTKVTASSGLVVFQNVMETASGGFTQNDSSLPAGQTIPAGSVIGFDESTRLAMVAKYGVLQTAAGSTDVTYRILKGSNLAIGQSINLPGGTARAITAIDPSNTAYDLVTVGTSIGVVAAAGIAAFVNDNGFNQAKGLLWHDHDYTAGIDISLVIRGTVYENRIPPVPATVKALMPTIIFSKSF